MTLYEYRMLDLTARGNYLWANGEFVANTGDANGPAAFYALHDFYVEVVFDLEFHTIVSLVAFKKGTRFDRMVSIMDNPPITWVD